MRDFFKVPETVQQAKEAQRGLHWILEILVFVAVFFVCTMGEMIVLVPVQMVMLFANSAYQEVAASGDVSRITEISTQIASSNTFIICSLFANIMIILVVILFCRLIQKRKIQTLGFIKEGAGKEYLKGIIAGFLMFSAAVLICVLSGSLKMEGVSNTFVLSTFLLFAFGYIIQGMAEEVLCRGYFMVSLGRRYPMIVAVVLNAAAFAALHLANPGISVLAMINLVLFGIFASICFITTENIFLVGALHSIWNLVQGNVYGIKVSGMDTSCTILSSVLVEGREIINGGAFGLEGGFGVTIVLVAGIAVLCYRSYRHGTN